MRIFLDLEEDMIGVTPRPRGYGDVTAMYIRRLETPSRIYAKHQYRKESEYGKYVVHYTFQQMSTIIKLSPDVINITRILHHQ